MSTVTLPTQALLNTLSNLADNLLVPEFTLHLFGFYYSPGPSTTLQQLQALECTFPGYAPALFGNWSSVGIDVSGNVNTQGYAAIAPSSSGGSGNIYGFFVTDNANLLLLGACLLDTAPVTVPQSVPFTVILEYTIASEF